MTAARAAGAEPFWRRRKVQAAALALVLLLAWLAHYLENLPLARAARDQDAIVAAKGEAFRLDGLAVDQPITVRTLAAERLVLTLPAGTPMREPAEQPFLAKARQDTADLAGVSYGNTIDLDARPSGSETASLRLALGGPGQSGALQWVRSGEEGGDPDWTVTAVGGPLLITVELNTPPAAAAAGTIVLSRPDAVARIGYAEFELPEGEPLRMVLVRRPASGSQSPAVVELPGSTSRLSLRAVELGTETGSGELEVNRIACAADQRDYLWSSLLSGVQRSGCTDSKLLVREIDLASGRVSIVGRAFFSGFGDTDQAHLVTALKNNLVFGYLLAAIASGFFVPWVIRQFSGPKPSPEPAPRPRRRPRRKAKPPA